MPRTGAGAILAHAEALGWRLVLPDAVDPERPGIFELRIEGGGWHVIRATVLARAIRQYEESVWRLGQGLPHRVGAYREIHHALLKATAEGRRVTVTGLENCAAADLGARKRHWVALRGAPGGAG